MALLDLQGMEQRPSAGAIKGGRKSGASKGCGNVETSSLSLLFCG